MSDEVRERAKALLGYTRSYIIHPIESGFLEERIYIELSRLESERNKARAALARSEETRRVEREALIRIASCTSYVKGDVVDIARAALAAQPESAKEEPSDG